MSLLDIIKNRRSIRKYSDKKITRQELDTILQAGIAAPSACNSQSWRFIAFDDDAAKEAFCKEVFTGVYASTMFAAKAAALIVITSNKGNIPSMLGNLIQNTPFWALDAGIAGQNMVLQAQSMGIGSCWIGWFNFKKASKYLGLGMGERAEIILALGYPAESPDARPRKEFEKVVTYNKAK